MSTKNQRAVFEWVNISEDLVYEWVRFFSKARYMNGVGFETIAPKLSPEGKNVLTQCV